MCMHQVCGSVKSLHDCQESGKDLPFNHYSAGRSLYSFAFHLQCTQELNVENCTCITVRTIAPFYDITLWPKMWSQIKCEIK